MKRTASILLLGILLFNWVGFRFFSSYMEDQANTRLESQLDNNNYDETQLISIKVPAGHLSVYTLSKQFERVDGQVEVNGIQYKYVMRRIFNDSLELLCVPNHQVMQLQNARDEFFKLVNDLQQTNQGKKSDSHPGPAKNLSTDYYCTVYDSFGINGLSDITPERNFTHPERLSLIYSLTEEQPPDHC